MPNISIRHTTTDGFETIEVNNGTLALALIPTLGCKLSTLTDLRTQRQWLWRSPRAPYRKLPHGSPYVPDADTGGWDECFPTVAACVYPTAPWTGAAIQDHGELWSQEPTLKVTEGEAGVEIYARWTGVALPYLFERTLTISASAPTLRFDYKVTNTGNAPLEWIWSAHPLLAIEPGMQLLVPPSAHFNVGFAHPDKNLTGQSGLHFPMQLGGIDLSTLPPREAGVSTKLWSDPLADGWATLRADDGEFRLRWDAGKFTQLGIFLNLGGWSGDGGTPNYNMGLEPCIGAQDSLADAITRYHVFETLLPQTARVWSLDVELAAHTHAK